MKKNLSENTILIGVITGVASTLIISWFITPLTKWLFPKILKFINLFSSAFIDSFYRSATNLSAENANMSSLAFSFIAYVIIWSILFLITKAIVKIHFKKTLRETSSAKLEKHQEIDKLLDEPSDVPNKKTRLKHLKISSPILLILVILHFVFSFYMAMSQIFSMNLCSNTLINIEIVSPYISDQDYKQFKSDFYTIEGKQDYDALYDKLELIAENNDLTLKK